MKKFFRIFLFAVIIVIPLQVIAAPSQVIPTFTIIAVDKDDTVTIKTANFPAGDSFKVMMGAYGTLGIGGTVVGTQSSGAGGSFTATYNIPASLQGSTKIAIRLQSPTSGYYSYNWFWNNDHPDPTPIPGSTPVTPAPSWGFPPAGAGTIPSTTITAVVTDTSVTVSGSNFTTNDIYKVFIGLYGTKGVGGTLIDSQTTNANGKFTATYTIPAAYHGKAKLAIRWESPATGYYAYDWFVNDSSAPAAAGYPPAGPGTIPTFTITAVVKNGTVTIKGTNFTTNDSYKVTMGLYGTKGVGGVVVATQTTDATGKFTATYNIPASLAGEVKIAIRLQSPTTGYYSYNWFYNANYP